MQKIEILVEQIRALVVELQRELLMSKVAATNNTPSAPLPPQVAVAPPEATEFELLKSLLEAGWPEAVPSELICDMKSTPDKQERAQGILDIIVDEDIKDKSFLDFGCGEGFLAQVAAKNAKIAVGYDIVQSGDLKWEAEADKCLLTTNMAEVQKHAPYDVICLYDVLDHVTDPIAVLKQAKDLVGDMGRIYARCHPWCSRHGSNLYYEVNKAYIHLIFTEEELATLGYVAPPNIKVLFPQMTYDKIIKASDLKIVSRYTDNDPLESFFLNNDVIKQRILANWDAPIPFANPGWKIEKFPKDQLEQSFVDFVLRK